MRSVRICLKKIRTVVGFLFALLAVFCIVLAITLLRALVEIVSCLLILYERLSASNKQSQS